MKKKIKAPIIIKKGSFKVKKSGMACCGNAPTVRA